MRGADGVFAEIIAVEEGVVGVVWTLDECSDGISLFSFIWVLTRLIRCMYSELKPLSYS